MPVPDTNTFGLLDVIAEVVPLSNSLTACITAAEDRKFDLAYAAPPAIDSLYDFRNYGNFNTIQLSASGKNAISGACGLPALTNYYTDQSVLPTVGVTIYTNYLTNTVLNGNNQYWKNALGGSLLIGTDGIIDSTHDCSYAITVSSTGSGTSSGGCALTPSVTRYMLIGATVAVGQTIYTDSALTTVLNGGTNWYKIANDAVQIGTDGIIDSVVACSQSTTRSSTSTTTNALACDLTATIAIYYASGAAFQNGTICYTDAALTTLFDGGRAYWKIGTGASCRINEVGLVDLFSLCGL